MIVARPFKILPPKADKIISMLKEQGNVWTYGEIEEKNIPLKVSIEKVEENEHGNYITLKVDKTIQVNDRDEGLQAIRATKTLHCQIINRLPLENYIVFFGSGNDVNVASKALNKVLRKKLNIRLPEEGGISRKSFQIDRKKDKIEERFTEIREFQTKNLSDRYMKGATGRGYELSETEDYERYTEELNGRISALRVLDPKFHVTFLISERGVIYVPSNDVDQSRIKFTFHVLEILQEVSAL